MRNQFSLPFSVPDSRLVLFSRPLEVVVVGPIAGEEELSFGVVHSFSLPSTTYPKLMKFWGRLLLSCVLRKGMIKGKLLFHTVVHDFSYDVGCCRVWNDGY